MSASSVTPIPPCICTASFVTNFDVNPNLDLAKLASSDKFLSLESIACKAFKTIEAKTKFDFELTDEELNALPTMYVDGTHHGNEGMSAEASFLFLQDVLQRSAADPSYLEGKRLVVTPSVNPDGYVLDCRSNWNGVDLNRNYPYMWGMYGTSDTPNFCPVSGTYRGASEGSEIETQVNMEFIVNDRPLNVVAGDGILLGVSKPSQLTQNLEMVKGGHLSAELLETFENAWLFAKPDCPNYFRLPDKK